MTYFKIFNLLAIAFVTIAITVISIDSNPIESNDLYFERAVNKSNNLVVGNRQYGDKLIYQERIAEKYQISGMKLILNRTIDAPYNYVITQVRCLDKMTDGTGAEPILMGGGPGSNFVHLRFKSQRWHGIYFNVEVYAKPRYAQ